MTFDKPSAIVAALILAVALLNRIGVISDDLAYSGFIVVLTLGFAWSRQQACRLKNGACAM